MLLTAAQQAYNPAEQDDGYGHAYETGRHPLEVCKAHKRSDSVCWGDAKFLYIYSSDYE